MNYFDNLSFFNAPSSSSIGYFIAQDIRGYFNMLISSPVFANVVSLVKAVSLLASVVLFMGIVYLILRMNLIGIKVAAVRQVVHPQSIAKNKQIARKFKAIRARLARQNPEEDRRAAIEANQLFEHALDVLGHKGKPLEALLSDIPIWKSTNPGEILEARSVRVNLVHRPGMRFSHADAEQTVAVFEKALTDLGIL